MDFLDEVIGGVFALVVVAYLCTQALTGTAWYMVLLAWALPAVVGFVVLMRVLKHGKLGGGR